MKAAVLEAPRTLALQQLDVAAPGRDQVLIRLSGCGICGSELPAYEGREWFSYPLQPGAPGHEGWGIVEAVGAGVRDVRVGDAVAAVSHHAHADYDLAGARGVVHLPPELAGDVFPGEPLGCAMNVFERAGIERDHWVAVVGVGFLGALLVQLAARAGAHVIAVSRRAYAREVAGDMGAWRVLGFDGSVPDVVSNLTRGRLCDRVIECTGLQSPLDLACSLVRVRGRLVIAGFHQDGRRSVDMQLWNWRGIDVVNAHERDDGAYVRGIRAAVDAVVAGRLDPRPLYTHTFPLEDIGHAFEITMQRPHGFMKAVVRS